MSRRISQSITPTAEDVAALREPFTNRGANDPVVAAFRNLLKDAVPDWLHKLNETQELTAPRLEQIQQAIATHRDLIEKVLPDGQIRDEALSRLTDAEDIAREMGTELAGVSVMGGISA
ncbi:hypothetical protein [Nocardia salmonicida]|uniref:hypothetical protein n=1 Tax=Nocardia salmonicida TaxID=53431 RepID=UPI0007A3F559|nr:hypothetical protein [Nocardia salmonicida]MBC7299810.1 hypothetical protein [Nocardia sp.]